MAEKKPQSKEKGFALLSISGLIVKALSILYLPILMNIISGRGTGIYATANQIFAFAYAVTNSGTLNAITKMIAEYCAQKNEHEAERAFAVARMALAGIGAFVSIILFACAGLIAKLMSSPDAVYSIIALSPCVFLTTVVSGYRGYFQGKQDFSARAKSQVLEQIVNAAASLILAAAGMYFASNDETALSLSCAGANGGTTVASFVTIIYLMCYTKKYRKNNQSDPPDKTLYNPFKMFSRSNSNRNGAVKALKMFIAYSVPITISAGLQNFAGLIDVGVTKRRLLLSGLDMAQTDVQFGLLYKYQQLIYVPLLLAISLASTVLPDLSKAGVTSDRDRFRDSLGYAYRWCFIISLPSVVAMGLLSEQIYSVLMYSDGHELLMYGAVVCIFMSLVNIQSSILQGMTRMYRLLFHLCLGNAAKIVINFFLIALPGIRIYGAIIGSLICYVLPVILNEMYIRKHTREKISVSQYVIKPAVSSALMAIVVFPISKLISYIMSLILSSVSPYASYATATVSLLTSSLVGGAVFLLAMIYFGAFTEKDLNALPKKIQKFIPQKIRMKITQNVLKV